MGLTQQQIKLQNELKAQADAFERLCDELPENIITAWRKLVGFIRENYYLDELWDGKELTFCSGGKAVFKMSLESDKVSVSVPEESKIELKSPGSVETIIQMLDTKQFPERVIPSDNIVISPGNGRCDLCLFNKDTLKKHDRRFDMTLGFAKAFGFVDGDFLSDVCNGDHLGSYGDCTIEDIGTCTPGMTADEVTHIIFPYWWAKSKFNKGEYK